MQRDSTAMSNLLKGLVWIVLLAAGLCGCASQQIAEKPTSVGSFDSTLRACRLQQPGRLNKRQQLPPTNIHVAACLKRNGWLSDGSRVYDVEPSSAEQAQAASTGDLS